ncbi:MAG TPA: LysM peptidoglycan-binding domain-containing protein [Blastocatellia bacterium]|nr:LysM peptidoglycan-binding domain-containing protein [Blastocatellia bacterium]
MGIFDKMFGRGADNAPEGSEQKFNQLKQKYQTVLNSIEQQNVRLQNLHVEGDKLFIRGAAPSEEAKNEVWDQIKLVDPTYSDLTADITVEQPRAAAVGGAPSGGQTYTVKSGDTLTRISLQFYGSANEYMRIFYANRDKLSDPDRIQVGQQLIIPPEENA